ncbi:MAG: ATP-binding protein [Planctomycetes bacterium]|nr:ATP-binding protein [Planctomycetota bacterium]
MEENTRPLPRWLTPGIERALQCFPIVVLTGARQTGKSTLVKQLLAGPARDYRTLDDLDWLDLARREPDTLLSSGRPLTLDEIQRSPELLLAIKRAVDRERRPGQFLLTGSANLALLGKISETLAGRAVYRTLSPFTWSEQRGGGEGGRWAEIMTDPSGLEGEFEAMGSWVERERAGGFPGAFLSPSMSARRDWFDGYVKTYLERDLQGLSTIGNLVDFRRLMRIAALRSGKMMNQTEMARDAGLAQSTAYRYLNLLEASYLLHRLPAYAVNRTKRLIKSPRLFLSDSGLASFLAGVETETDVERSGLTGPLLETLVLMELVAWRETRTPRPEILYWRTVSGEEVDFVIESGDTLVPIEVKAGSRPTASDASSLHSFLNEYGGQAPHGILLHTGTKGARMSKNIWAIPITAALGAG